MRGRRARQTRWLATAIAIAMVAACSPQPSPAVTPSPAASAAATPSHASADPSAPASVAPPSPTPVPATGHLGDVLQVVSVPGEGAAVMDAAYGDAGWVAVGATCTSMNQSCVDTATAWFSADGVTWSSAAVDDADNATIDEVEWNGAYVALGHRWEAVGSEDVLTVTTLAWRSDDGRAWERIGSVNLGRCFEGCPSAESFVATPDGVLFVGHLSSQTRPDVRAAWSLDASHWTAVDPTDVGYQSGTDARVAAVTATDAGIAAIWTTERGSASAWTSADGRTWQPLGRIDPAAKLGTTMAADGDTVVVADDTCSGVCRRTTIWTAKADGAFAAAGKPLPIDSPRLAVTGQGFLLAGEGPALINLYGSVDGRSWTIRNGHRSTLECALRGLVGGPTSALLIDTCGGILLTRG